MTRRASCIPQAWHTAQSPALFNRDFGDAISHPYSRSPGLSRRCASRARSAAAEAP
jgi:hypothetical protein